MIMLKTTITTIFICFVSIMNAQIDNKADVKKTIETFLKAFIKEIQH